MFFGTSTGFTCTGVDDAAFGGGGGGGGGGGAAATEYCATCAGEFCGKEMFQIAPKMTAAMTTTCSPIDTGSVMYFWRPTFCFFDSTTVVSNMSFSSSSPRRRPSSRG
jgi:hypothetical protein